MELSSCVVFVLLFLAPVSRVTTFTKENSTSITSILFANSSGLFRRVLSLNQDIIECDCGVGSEGCRLVNGKKICDCGFLMAQDGDECRYCNCFDLSKKCYFENGIQICNCPPGTALTSFGTCDTCDCGYRSKNCVFKGINKVCTCDEGYVQKSGECERCDCGYGSKDCVFQGYDKVCTCDEGYAQKSGKCEKCDCGYASISCFFSYGGTRKCICKPGYITKSITKYHADENCRINTSPSGWRIATYIEGVLFIFIVIGLFVFILGKKAIA